MNTDDDGCAWWHWLVGALVIIVAATLTVITAGGFAAAGAAFAGVFGTSVGGIAGLFAGVTIGAAIYSGIGLVAGGIVSALNGENFWDGASKGFMWGAITGAISGGFGSLSFKGIGDLKNIYTGGKVGNVFHTAGQSLISLGMYQLRGVVENEQVTILGSILSFGAGFGGGLISKVPYQTQLLIGALAELSKVTLEIFKKISNISKNVII